MIVASPGATVTPAPARSWLRLGWQRFQQHRLAAASAAIFTLLCLAAALAPLSPYDPNRTNLLARYEPPSLAHPMGTDDLGRDELTRILVGGRLSLTVGVLAMVISVLVGTFIGALAGYLGGLVDSVLMRLTELFIVFPGLFILILLSVLLGSSFWNVVLALGFLGWMPVARVVRASVMQLREMDYVLAARAVGATAPGIILRHVLPNALGPIIVSATLGVGGAILAESTLSFLGLGIQLPTATWGNMLRSAQGDLASAPWLAFFPGLCIFITILCVNYLGDGLRDALDPRR